MAADNRQGPEASLSAARLTLVVKRARAEAGASAGLLLAEPIAIIGMACRFPGKAYTPEAFWKLLADGRSGIRSMPEDRWKGAREGLAPQLLLGGYLDGVDRFDAEFFGIAPREAHAIDPQQRLLLEVCWEALSDAGIAPSALNETATGAFIAIYNGDYLRMQLDKDAVIDAHTGVGAAHSVAAGRLSFLLNLRGPSLAVDTACSSSLVATHLAMQSLRQRECSLALVGASSLKLLPDEVRTFAQWGMLSHDGRAKTFDAGADGFVPGEGGAMIVLKRLSDAIANGDTIRAVLRGSAVNHDGRSSVLTAPNGPAQEAVIRDALRDGHLTAADVSYVETHGTGTSLGDPIEVEALDAVYGEAGAGKSDAGACLLGAVKTNVGHLEACAGLAGLIKVVLALEHQEIPRNLNFETLNPQIRLGAQSRLRLATESSPWLRTAAPRYAGVSSFGLGGTNAHLLLEEAPTMPRMGSATSPSQESPEYCLPISAHTLESLERITTDYREMLRQPGCEWGALAGAAARHRDHGLFRIAVAASTAAEAEQKLERRLVEMWGADLRVVPEARSTQATEGSRPRKIAFVFSGQGSVWKGMLDDLLKFPVAAKVFSTCEQIVLESAGWSLREAAANEAMLADTSRSQAVLFAVQMALVEVLKSWAITPEAVAGHSVGEIAAAVTCGALSLEQGLRLALQRGRHMGTRANAGDPALNEGRMLSVEMSAYEVNAFLKAAGGSQGWQAVEIAAMNSPRSTVLSGAKTVLASIAAALEAQGTARRWLDVEYAFHSAAMERAAEALVCELGEDFRSVVPKMPTVSTMTGKPWKSGDGNAAYWGKGVRDPVRFQAAVEELLGLGCETFVEIGPHPVLLRALQECVSSQSDTGNRVNTVAAMRRGHSGRSSLMNAVATLYEDGAELKWKAVYPGTIGRMDLPAYPWNRERFWLEEPVRRVEPQPAGKDTRRRDADGLLGHEVSSAFPEMRLWEQEWSTGSEAWLADHCWRGQPILPFAAWMEIARQAAVAFSQERGRLGELRLSQFAVHRPLQFGTETVAVQMLATGKKEIRIAAMVDGAWSEYASGQWESVDRAGDAEIVESRTGSRIGSRIDLEAWKRRCPDAVPVGAMYEELAKRGLTYGKAFRLLREVHRGIGVALGRVAMPEKPAIYSRPERPVLQPVLLDACLQVLEAAMDEKEGSLAVLPVSVQSYCVWQEAEQVYALAEMKVADADGCEADITMADVHGNVVAELRGFRVRRVPAAPARMAERAPMCERAPMWKMDWLPAAMNGEAGPEMSPGRQRRLQWVLPLLEETSYVAAGQQAVGSLMAQLADELAGMRGGETQVVRRMHLDTRPKAIVLAGSQEMVTAQMLAVVAHEQQFPGVVEQVCVLTRGGLQTGRGERVDPEQAALLGLVRTFRVEFPRVRATIVDLPVSGTNENRPDDAELPSRLAARLMGPRVSSELVLRNGRWLHARLVRSELEPAAGNRELVIGKPGLLETLHEDTCELAEPAGDEIQVAVRAHGLNFRDVLTALGNYAGTAGALGAECAGIIVKAGSRSGFAEGTPVLAFAPASMRSRVNVPAQYAVAMPERMTFAEAATVPVSFLTAHYAFSRLAKLKPGETVLIHSAAGGLGQAAVQLARLSGARVIATAGSAARRAYLQQQGIPDVFDSRTAEFAEDVLNATDGLGVDVVLNALSGDRIAAGFRALRTGGVFLEVGKRGILSPVEAAALRPDVGYWAFDLGEVAQRDPGSIAEMLKELMAWFAEGTLHPLPLQTYALDEAEDAFRMMAGARHTGKLVLIRPESELADPGWDVRWSRALREGTMLITGGTGALGMATAEWLVAQGARSLVLVSRHGGAADATARIKQASAGGEVEIVIERADVTIAGQMKEVLARVRARGCGALRGVFHAAGETEDRLLADHTTESFYQAQRTKVEGARSLDLLTRHEDLVATVYFSSVAGLLGSAGQGSYAAANAYLDGLAAERNAMGLRTLSVNWGAWAAGGMVERLSAGAAARLARNGARPMQPAAALGALREGLASGRDAVTVADVNWMSFSDQFAAGSPAHGFFQETLPLPSPDGSASHAAIRPAGEMDAMSEEIEWIRAASKTEQVPRMETLVRTMARKVLGLSAGRPMPAASPLQEMGLDSLMALELRNVLAQAIGQPLSATLLFDSPSIRELAAHLLSRMNLDGQMDGGPLADLEEMSESEAEALLLAELDLAEGGRTHG